MRAAFALLTFPGIAVHGLLHWLLCRLLGLAMFRRPRWNELELLHEPPRSKGLVLLEAVLPALLQTALGLLALLPAFLAVHLRTAGPLHLLFAWFGTALCVHAFPGPQDARSLRRRFGAPAAPLWTAGLYRRYGANVLLALAIAALFYGLTS